MWVGEVYLWEDDGETVDVAWLNYFGDGVGVVPVFG